ncbi:hypothetical protein [Atlantibacter hermannii]
MPVKGIKRVQLSMGNVIGNITGALTEKVITEVMIVGSGYAAQITPIHTSTLVNSMYRELKPGSGGMTGRVGYTAS